MNPDVIEKLKPQLAPVIPAGASVTLGNDPIEMLPDNIDNRFNDFSKQPKEEIYLLRFLLISSLCLISAKNNL